MIKIESGVMYLTRGDTASITVNLKDESGEAYDMVDGDKLIMTVREVPSSDSPVIFSAESITNTIDITHSDTADADIGQYSVDIQLSMNDGQIHTIFPEFDANDSRLKSEKNWKNFWITPEVTI